MDVVDFWAKQIELWDLQQKCGLCWHFDAPLYESSVESYKIPPGKECCVQVLMLQSEFSTQRVYQNSGLVSSLTCTDSFQLLFLMPSQIDINNYSEIPGYSVEESKWYTILNNIKECIQCDAELAFCEILGYRARITNWSASLVPQNYTGYNFAGYRVNVSFQDVR